MAEQDIVERLRDLADMRHMDRGHDQVDDAMREAASTIEAIAEEAEHKDAVIASLRQQLSEAWETARREALEEAEKIAEMLDPNADDVAAAIRALSHPDREGERDALSPDEKERIRLSAEFGLPLPGGIIPRECFITQAEFRGMERAAKVIEEGFDRGIKRKVDTCSHGKFEWEDCEQCAVVAIRAEAGKAALEGGA